MKEQVQKLKEKGATAVYVGDLSDSLSHSGLHNGDFQFIFMSPESLCCNDCSYIYLFMKKKLVLYGTEPIGAPHLVRFRLRFSSITEKEVKKFILKSFCKPDGNL